MENLKINPKFYGLTNPEKETILTLVEKNLNGKMDSYFKKIFSNHPDAEIEINYKVQKDKRGKFSIKFVVNYDGEIFVYQNKVPFKYLDDLINHAFDHLARRLSDKK